LEIEASVISGLCNKPNPALGRRRRSRHTNDSTKSSNSQPATDAGVYLFDDWFDPIEAGVRDRVRGFIEAMIEGEPDSALLRPRYARRPKLANEDADGSAGLTGHRHGHRLRSLTGTFVCVEFAVPRGEGDRYRLGRGTGTEMHRA